MLGMVLTPPHAPCAATVGASLHTSAGKGRLAVCTLGHWSSQSGRWQDCLLWLLPIGAVALHSHSRPEEANLAIRGRMLNRPIQQFRSSTGRAKKDADLHYVLSPTRSYTDKHPRGRGANTTSVRARLKKAKSPSSLQEIFQNAVERDLVDASVFGAAMQLCGQNLWWEALLWLHQQKEQLSISFFCIQQSICLNSLACCLKCDRRQIPSRKLLKRKTLALELAKRVFEERQPQTTYEFNCLLSASLKLCRMAGTREAMSWSEELLHWSQGQSFAKTIVSYATMLLILEQQERVEEVDDILTIQLEKEDLEPNEVVLGGLLDCQAGRSNWQRADKLWDMLVQTMRVQPNSLAYNAYAKVHFNAGRPDVAVNILDEMFKTCVGQASYRHAVDYLQYVVIMYYASPCTANKLRLVNHMALWSAAVAKESSKSGKLYWRKLTFAAEKILADPKAVAFSDLLVTPPAREDSVMKDWTDWPSSHAMTKAV